MSNPEPAPRRIERTARKYVLGEEPSLVDEYAHMSNIERAELFLRLRHRLIEQRYGPEQSAGRLERICTVVRRP